MCISGRCQVQFGSNYYFCWCFFVRFLESAVAVSTLEKRWWDNWRQSVCGREGTFGLAHSAIHGVYIYHARDVENIGRNNELRFRLSSEQATSDANPVQLFLKLYLYRAKYKRFPEMIYAGYIVETVVRMSSQHPQAVLSNFKQSWMRSNCQVSQLSWLFEMLIHTSDFKVRNCSYTNFKL